MRATPYRVVQRANTFFPRTMGELAYCAACIDHKQQMQGLGRFLGDGNALAAGEAGAAGDVAGDVAGSAAGAIGGGFFAPFVSGAATAEGQIGGGVGSGLFNFGSNGGGAIGGGGAWSDLISGAGKGIFSGATSSGIEALQRYINPGAYQQKPSAPSSGLPAWALPVGLGAGVLVLILVLRGRGRGSSPSTVVVK